MTSELGRDGVVPTRPGPLRLLGRDRRSRRPDLASLGLAPLATLPDWLVAVARPDRIRAGLARVVPAVRRGEVLIHECRVKHFRLEGDAWIFLCRLTIGAPMEDSREVWLEGRVRPPGMAPPARAGRVVTLGSERWGCLLPELGVELRTAPSDTSLPLVRQLTDAARARVLLEVAIWAGTQGHSDVQIETCRPRVMRHDRGSRCTVRYEIDHPPTSAGPRLPRVVVAKTYRDQTGRNAYDGMRSLWSSELSRSPLLAIAEPLAYLPELRLLVQGPVPGDQTLEDLIQAWLRGGMPARPGGLGTYLARTARGLAALHGCGVADGEFATLEGEVTEIRALVERLALVVPELARAAEPLLIRVGDLAAEHEAGPLRPSHGTFRPAQVLLHRGRVGFIDFDGFCQAEPALDVARFRAGIRDFGMRALLASGDGTTPTPQAAAAALSAVEALCERFLRQYQLVAPVSRERVMLWETLDLLTYVLHAWTRMSATRLTARMLTLDEHLHRHGLVTGTADARPVSSSSPGRLTHAARGKGVPAATASR